MLFNAIKKSINKIVTRKLLLRAQEHHNGSSMAFKQIIEDTFVTTISTTYSNKTNLFKMDLKNYRYNILKLHEDVKNKVMSLQAAGHSHTDVDLYINLFNAYELATNEVFKSHINFQRSEYDTGHITSAN